MSSVLDATGRYSLQQPDPASPTDQNAAVPYSFMEYTNTREGGFHLNASSVDFISTPLYASATAPGQSAPSTTGYTGNRAEILNQLAEQLEKLGSPWSSLIQKDASGNIVRILSPGKLPQGSDAAKQMNAQFTPAWFSTFKSNYSGDNYLYVDASELGAGDGGVYKGRMDPKNSNQMIFTSTTDSSKTVTISLPTNGLAFFAGTGAPGSGFSSDNHTAQGIIVRDLCAAAVTNTLPAANNSGSPLSRSYFISQSGSFYGTSNPNFPANEQVSDHYAQVLSNLVKQEGPGAGGYDYAYSDVLGEDDMISEPSAGTAVTITIG